MLTEIDRNQLLNIITLNWNILLKGLQKNKADFRLYLGDNDRAARVLFVQHPRVLDEQHPSRPVIIPIITRNSQIRDIFTEIRTA